MWRKKQDSGSIFLELLPKKIETSSKIDNLIETLIWSAYWLSSANINRIISIIISKLASGWPISYVNGILLDTLKSLRHPVWVYQLTKIITVTSDMAPKTILESNRQQNFRKKKFPFSTCQIILFITLGAIFCQNEKKYFFVNCPKIRRIMVYYVGSKLCLCPQKTCVIGNERRIIGK